jgi:hypothetical protein
MVEIVQIDRDFQALSNGILSFLVTYLCRKMNPKNMYEDKEENTSFLGI